MTNNQSKKNLAVIVPGMGYHRDKPLLYYAGKLAEAAGYEVIRIEFHDLPLKGNIDPEAIRKTAEMTFAQTEEGLAAVDFDAYENVLFIGKSIGTVAMAKYIAEHHVKACQIWYTPVTDTLSFGTKEAVVFIGDADPCSDVSAIKKRMAKMGLTVHSYPGCNHSLECGDVDRDLETIRDVMQKTKAYLA